MVAGAQRVWDSVPPLPPKAAWSTAGRKSDASDPASTLAGTMIERSETVKITVETFQLDETIVGNIELHS